MPNRFSKSPPPPRRNTVTGAAVRHSVGARRIRARSSARRCGRAFRPPGGAAVSRGFVVGFAARDVAVFLIRPADRASRPAWACVSSFSPGAFGYSPPWCRLWTLGWTASAVEAATAGAATGAERVARWRRDGHRRRRGRSDRRFYGQHQRGLCTGRRRGRLRFNCGDGGLIELVGRNDTRPALLAAHFIHAGTRKVRPGLLIAVGCGNAGAR